MEAMSLLVVSKAVPWLLLLAVGVALSMWLNRRHYLESRPMWMWAGWSMASCVNWLTLANGWFRLSLALALLGLFVALLWSDARKLKREDDELELELAEEERDRSEGGGVMPEKPPPPKPASPKWTNDGVGNHVVAWLLVLVIVSTVLLLALAAKSGTHEGDKRAEDCASRGGVLLQDAAFRGVCVRVERIGR